MLSSDYQGMAVIRFGRSLIFIWVDTSTDEDSETPPPLIMVSLRYQAVFSSQSAKVLI